MAEVVRDCLGCSGRLLYQLGTLIKVRPPNKGLDVVLIGGEEFVFRQCRWGVNPLDAFHTKSSPWLEVTQICDINHLFEAGPEIGLMFFALFEVEKGRFAVLGCAEETDSSFRPVGLLPWSMLEGLVLNPSRGCILRRSLRLLSRESSLASPCDYACRN